MRRAIAGRVLSCAGAANGQFNYRPLDSCILFVFQLDGAHVITVEGLSLNGQLTPVQQSMIDHHGSQCGFCTPGFVMAMTALASESQGAGEIDWRAGLTGNLCRCTGYTPILAAGCALEGTTQTSLNETYPPQVMLSYGTQLAEESFEVIDHSAKPPRHAVGPIELPDVVGELERFPGAALVAGATDLGVQVNKRKRAPHVFIDLNRIRELEMIELTQDGDTHHLVMGARVTWTHLAEVIEREVPELHHIISIFGSPQIRHVGTIGGNLANASPIADAIPFLMVMEAELELVGPRGSRVVNINDFYQGYKEVDLRLEELIAQVHVTLPRPEESLRLIKVSRRRDLDISTLTAAIRMQIEDERIKQPAIALGGVGPTVIRATQTELFLDGRTLSEETMRQAGDIACAEISPISDVRGSAEFRYQLTRNVLLKFFHERTAAAAP